MSMYRCSAARVLLILGLVLGVAGMTAFGQILGAITMQMAKHFYQVGDSVAGALFLLCGTIFPLTELPGIVRWIGYLLQPTYWLEIMRRALLGTPPDSLTSFSTWSDAALLGMLALLTAVLIGLSVRVYAWSVDQAREKGILDMETNY
jgi:ABC-2 type transport system permease protein